MIAGNELNTVVMDHWTNSHHVYVVYLFILKEWSSWDEFIPIPLSHFCPDKDFIYFFGVIHVKELIKTGSSKKESIWRSEVCLEESGDIGIFQSHRYESVNKRREGVEEAELARLWYSKEDNEKWWGEADSADKTPPGMLNAV